MNRKHIHNTEFNILISEIAHSQPNLVNHMTIAYDNDQVSYLRIYAIFVALNLRATTTRVIAR